MDPSLTVLVVWCEEGVLQKLRVPKSNTKVDLDT